MILRAIAGTAEVGRSVIAGPDVPAERLAALRTAFADMLKDADFLAACDQRHFMVDAGSGEEMDAIIARDIGVVARGPRQDRRDVECDVVFGPRPRGT